MKTEIIMLLLFCIALPSLLYAQPGFGDDVFDTPIDGGLSLVIVAGVGYGLRKLKNNKKTF